MALPTMNKYCLGQIGCGLTLDLLIGYTNSYSPRCTTATSYTLNDNKSVLDYEAILVESMFSDSHVSTSFFYIGKRTDLLGTSDFPLRVAYKNTDYKYYTDFYFSTTGKTLYVKELKSLKILRIVGIK